jgi:hypothetical protein
MHPQFDAAPLVAFHNDILPRTRAPAHAPNVLHQ